jgi:hypothetical protein
MNALMQYNPTPIEGQGAAMGRALQLQSAQQRNRLMQMQMEAAQQQQAQQAQQNQLLQQFRQSIQSPQMSASQNALMAGGGPTMANAQRMAPVDPRMQALYGAMQAGAIDPVSYLKEAMPAPRQPEYKVVGDALVQIGPQGVSEAYKGERGPKLPEGMRMGARGQPEWIPGYLEGRGQVARSGASSIVNYGSPVPVQLPGGGVGYVQPSNRGGAASPMVGPDGKPLVKPASETEKPLTEGQAKAVLFASRMQASDKVLADLARKGTSTGVPGATKNNAVGDVITAMSPPEQQQLVQAKRDFVNAVLRRESGAVISPDEFANAERQYFPQIGDSRPVIEQKARNRRAAIEGMRADVPKSRQGDVDRISGGQGDDSDPLGLRPQPGGK